MISLFIILISTLLINHINVIIALRNEVSTVEAHHFEICFLPSPNGHPFHLPLRIVDNLVQEVVSLLQIVCLLAPSDETVAETAHS